MAKRLLIVDDDPAVARALARQLRASGYLTVVLTEPRAALEAFAARPEDFDALITDQSMPGLCGVELARAVLALRSNLPIFICSGNIAQLDVEEVLGWGVRRVFEKPADAEALVLALRATGS